MIKINEIVPDYEPRNKILPKLDEHVSNIDKFVLMTRSQSSFLCGVIKKFRPKKILEVGIAAGGSTTIILQTLEDLGEPYEMHSIDITVNCPLIDRTKPTGFLAAFAKENNLFTPTQSTLNGKHEFHLGKYLPQVIDGIGGEIDLAIIDTVHFMPGEILDFLAVLPYLKDGAVVVLHDVALNHYDRPTWTNAYCTGVLFSAVTAEKFLNFVEQEYEKVAFSYPNIAAFQINEQTRENIDQVFLSLMINWNYPPHPNEINLYRAHYRRYYPKELLEIYNEAVKMNLYNLLMTSYS